MMTSDRFVACVLEEVKALFPQLSERKSPEGVLCIDSRCISEGDVFVALNGTRHQGLDFIPEAKTLGASLVLLESDCDDFYLVDRLPVVALKHLRQRLGHWLAQAGELSDNGLHLIGITGTNGKTSVSHYLAGMLEGLQQKAAVIGTVGIGAPGALRTATHTTPDLVQLHKVMSELKQEGYTYQAMEVSSHALDQLRTAGVPFEVAVFTNLSRDHLDYHGTMAAYGAAKSHLFIRYPIHYAVINADDAYSTTLEQSINQSDHHPRVYRYSLNDSKADLYCVSCRAEPSGFALSLAGRWGAFTVQLPLLGRFNVANALAAATTLLALGFTAADVMTQLEDVRPVAGRMQLVLPLQVQHAPQPQVVVDYAHTPDALENALLAVKEHIQGRLWCVFGCGGDRDAGKRPLMAEVASRLADEVVLTSDNPRTEDPVHILSQVKHGLLKPAIFSSTDRAVAIRKAVMSADPEDVILIAGKGHEAYQDIQGVRHHFDDVEQARLALDLRSSENTKANKGLL
ncbi:UDP-N-acetylmuramoylalanyl-D-glutamate--2,6-diaminopimelate ligase [Oceanospirillum linum]|nr:UDP-N-acetylmuramoylalanyl-D-glutamate--2,6-diaminopimelate ligase [Oleiphilus messinensis]SMP05386.1 UDP-N-acetylmuramoylalanyl-D-glutamate--2,6-diaminopimelate ligase [Oceanospirillum linum]